MIYILENGKTIKLNPDKTFSIIHLNHKTTGTYVKSILDTNKFIVTFTSNTEKFLMYFDVDSNTVIGEDKNILKLKGSRKKTSESISRNIITKLVSIIKLLIRSRFF